MTNDLLTAIKHLANLAERAAEFDEAASVYWVRRGRDDDEGSNTINNVEEARDKLTNDYIMLQESMGRVLRQYGQRTGEYARILRAEEEFANIDNIDNKKEQS